MTNSPAQVLAELLSQSSGSPLTHVSSRLDWFVYVGSLPDSVHVKDNAAAIYDTSGKQSGRLLASGVYVWQYGFQVKVRAVNYAAGYAKIDAIATLLQAVHKQAVAIEDAYYWIDACVLTSPIYSLGADPGTNRLELFTLNGLVMMQEIEA